MRYRDNDGNIYLVKRDGYASSSTCGTRWFFVYIERPRRLPSRMFDIPRSHTEKQAEQKLARIAKKNGWEAINAGA